MQVAELAIRMYGRRGRIASPGDLPRIAKSLYLKGYPAWRSYFLFDEEGEAYIRHRGSMDMDFIGKGYVDRILLDYEVEGDTSGGEEILKEVRYVLRHMMGHLDVDPTWINVWFSGRRGFHVVIPDLFGIPPSPEAPDMLRASLEGLLKHPSLDLKPVFKAGLIRLEYTKHQNSGLYKIPLLTQEVFRYSFEEIQEIAKDPENSRKGFEFPPKEDVKQIWQAQKAKSLSRRMMRSKSGLQLKYDPNRVITCMQHLLKEGARPGRRNKDLLRLAAWLWRGGIPKSWAIEKLTAWAAAAGGPPDLEKWEDTISTTYHRGYLYGCRDPVMAEFCDPKCIYFKSKNYAMQIDDSYSLADRYRDFLEKIRDSNAGFDLGVLCNNKKLYQVVPGEIFMLTGDTGMAKTMFVQNLVTQLGKPTLWLNLEMSPHLNFRRFMQIKTGLSKAQIQHLFQHGTKEDQDRIIESLDWLRQESIAPTLNDVEQMIVQSDPEIVVVDTTDAIEIPGVGNNPNLHLKRVMEGLRKIAARYDVIPIGIHHITKSASVATTTGQVVKGKVYKRELTLNDLVGDRSNVTKVDHVFALEGDKDSDYRRLRSLKTRDESPIALLFQVNWKNFRFKKF